MVTNNSSLYKKLLQLKNQGRVGFSNGGQDRYESIGYNFKYTNLQSALGISQLKTIKYRKKKLIENYLFYKKNLIQNKKIRLFKFDGIDIIFKSGALDFIVNKALEYKLGARGLRSICEAILVDYMFESPGSGIKKIIIDKNYVKSKLSDSQFSYIKKAS